MKKSITVIALAGILSLMLVLSASAEMNFTNNLSAWQNLYDIVIESKNFDADYFDVQMLFGGKDFGFNTIRLTEAAAYLETLPNYNLIYYYPNGIAVTASLREYTPGTPVQFSPEITTLYNPAALTDGTYSTGRTVINRQYVGSYVVIETSSNEVEGFIRAMMSDGTDITEVTSERQDFSMGF